MTITLTITMSDGERGDSAKCLPWCIAHGHRKMVYKLVNGMPSYGIFIGSGLPSSGLLTEITSPHDHSKQSFAVGSPDFQRAM